MGIEEGVLVVSHYCKNSRGVWRRSARLLAAGVFASFLGGCESVSSVFSGPNETATAPTQAVTPPTPAPPAVNQPARIAIAPIVAPEPAGAQLNAKLAEHLERARVSVAKSKDAKSEYVVRAYFVAAKDTAGTRLTYIYDITDSSGAKRAHRIQGEELIKGPAGQNPWEALDAKNIDAIAQKAAAKIAGWLPPSSTQPAVANNPRAPAQQQVAQPRTQPAPEAVMPAVTQTTTASITSKDQVAFVQAVIGAPGDGNAALLAAIKRELANKSIRLTDKPGPAIYRIQARVTVGQPVDGKQPIQIAWDVIDPAGGLLGVVEQKNAVQVGSLDGSWGQTAEQAAAAAVEEIVPLIKKQALVKAN